MQQLAPCPSLQDRPSHGLVSLWDMLELKAEAFYDSSRYINRIAIAAQGWTDTHSPLEADVAANLARELKKLLTGCEILGADSTKAHCNRILANLSGNKMLVGHLKPLFNDLALRFKDDLSGKYMLVIPDEMWLHYKTPLQLIGDDIAKAFPEALPDLEESSRCLALDRYTSSAFHSMRALEAPLQVIAKNLLPKDDKPNWDPILKKIDAELKKPPKESMLGQQREFYAEVSAHMHAVKLAWRNRVAHIDQIVAPEKAKEIFAATKALMSFLALHLFPTGDADERVF